MAIANQYFFVKNNPIGHNMYYVYREIIPFVHKKRIFRGECPFTGGQPGSDSGWGAGKKKKETAQAVSSYVVRERRLELPRRSTHAPQTCLSTCSSTLAYIPALHNANVIIAYTGAKSRINLKFSIISFSPRRQKLEIQGQGGIIKNKSA